MDSWPRGHEGNYFNASHMKQERDLNAAKFNAKNCTCPVAERLQRYSGGIGLAASNAISIAEELDDALYGLAKDLTPADLKAAEQEPLEIARDNLQDLLDQVQEALLTVERVLTLRADPDAKWPC